MEPQPEAPRTLARPDGGTIAYHRRQPLPEARARGWPGVIFLGGFASDMGGTKATALDAFCAARGQAFLRFDYFGHGRSSGDLRDGTIGRWLEDALAVLDGLSEGPQILVGSSMGGWIALLAARARPQRLAGLVGIAAAPDFTEDLMWAAFDDEDRARLTREGIITQTSRYGPTPYPITLRLIEEGRRHLLLRDAIPVSRPVRLLHGMEDPDVPWRTALTIAERLTGTDVVVSLVKDGDHRLSRPQDIERICAAVAELSERRP
ncbi:MAG: alpha/beta hydrolase [Rhodospirillaceae bacterium]|nr:alpha/beta hydrolase [Rhodospirillaceae bacterium]